jgi:hypothetical protein
MTRRTAALIGLLCLFATSSIPAFARTEESPPQEKPAQAPSEVDAIRAVDPVSIDAVSTDVASTDADMQRIADHFGLTIDEAMLAASPAGKAWLDTLPPPKRACVLRIFTHEMRKAQAASIRALLPKRSDVEGFERFAATGGGRKLLAAFRMSVQDAMAGRDGQQHFRILEQQASAQEREDIERFMQMPQSTILKKPPRIEQPVGGMDAFERRLARECQAS